MDRNQVIGFSLIGALVITYVLYTNHSQKVYQEQKTADSIAYARQHPQPKIDSVAAKSIAVANIDTAAANALVRSQPPSYNGTAQTLSLENKKLAIQFTTKGGFPVSANIKGFKTYDSGALYLFNGPDNHLTAILPVDNGKSTGDLYFTPVTKDEPNGDKTIDFSADLGSGKKVDMIYTLPADDYMMRCNIVLTGMSEAALPVKWQTLGLKTEMHTPVAQRSKRGALMQIYFGSKDDKFDYFTLKTEESTANPDFSTNWLGFRKEYFSTVLIGDDGFSKMDVSYKEDTNSATNIEANATANILLPLKAGNNAATASLRWYIGPNDYQVLKKYNSGLENMVPLGFGIMSFVKYINKFALLPIFYFLASLISNYALIIIIMTVLIRILLSFFTYKSYLSAAKMRVLKPELDELRVKTGGDQQKFSMEQMKLYRSAGVSPLGGCLPMLFQMPILLSLYYMLPSLIEFRQQHFLWAKDLSTYDSIASWSTNIPILSSVYGNHISLFTLLMTASSLFLALYNRSMTPQDPNNPIMKYIPFIFPIFLMGFFNNAAAVLTFYYTFSNLLSIAQQFIIQKYFIDEKAIHAQLQENKSKPATPSKWASKLEQIQKQQAEKAKTPIRNNNKK